MRARVRTRVTCSGTKCVTKPITYWAAYCSTAVSLPDGWITASFDGDVLLCPACARKRMRAQRK